MAKKYCWIVTDDKTPTVLYGGETEKQATDKGHEMLPSSKFRIVKLETRDEETAKKMVLKSIAKQRNRKQDQYGWLA